MRVKLKRVGLFGKFEAIIEVDSDDLEDLTTLLGQLKSGKTDHLHLMSEDWGAGDFDVDKSTIGPELHHIKVTLKNSVP